ncbi:hypothetical protein O3P69_020346 [Scylla paramamosain]|uniref:Cytochrome P450 n=1 Tax=Scylla paramamosain TaxID=85552 RepID=A0AAW0TKL4_SCYPA
MGLETWVLLATVAVLAWLYTKWRHTYWASKGVPSPHATPFLGHFHKSFFVNKRLWEFHQANYTKFYKSSMCGLYEFSRPILVIWGTEMLKHFFVKDFDHFSDRRDFKLNSGHRREKMAMEMVARKNGEEWKKMRAIISPTFSSGKIKSMFPLVCDKADALVQFLMRQAAQNQQVEMKKTFGRYTLDTIASCAFGIECNSLVDENAEFPRMVEAYFAKSPGRVFKILLHKFIPGFFKLLNISIQSPAADFFIDVVKQAIAAREAGMKRGDFLDLLLEARDSTGDPNSKYVLNDLGIVAQCVMFLVAGYDTTTSLLSFSSFLLAKHENQQQRLRDEVQQLVKEHGCITYQGIMEAKLLEACLQETLRLYPPGIQLERACTKACSLPGTGLTLKPGDLVQVPIWCLHHDPNYWPDPETFIPDRFLPENKGNIHPFTHIPFGIGPRNCIAMRFALMEAKVALAKLLLEAELKLAPGHEEVTIISSIALRPKDGVMVVLKPLKKLI